MYDILVYVFENCQQAELAYDRERVAKKLSAAGFEDSDISEALTLDQLKLIVLMVLWNQQTPTSRLVAEDLFTAPHARLPS